MLSGQISSVRTFTLWCNQFPELFHFCKTKTPHSLNDDFLFSYHLASGNDHSISVSMNLTALGTSYKWNHTVFVPLRLAYFI